jgi:hypothetical protein
VTSFRRISLLLVLGACLVAAGCGSDDDEGAPIPAETAAGLERQLDGVQARLDNGTEGACRDILEGARGPNRDAVQELLNGLPEDVEPDVRDSLEQSFENLWALVERACEDRAAEQETQPEPTPEPETTETTPPDTDTETTETTPPDTDTETNPEEAPLPPDGDGESGGEVPEGEGNGGGVGPGTAKEKKEKE